MKHLADTQQKQLLKPEIIKKILKVVLEDRQIKVRELAEAVGISSELVHNIVRQYLNMKKLCARWV